VINGGGNVHTEMAAGKGRTDLCLIFKDKKYPIELIIKRGKNTLSEGIEQTIRYMDTFGSAEGWLVIFDRRPNINWEEKIFMRKESVEVKSVTIIGL